MKAAYNSLETATPRTPATTGQRQRVTAIDATSPDPTFAAAAKPLKPGPISVFISRKEGKIFVRKGFEPILDAPVTFANPDQPLGTHVFTALSMNDDNSSMRWSVVTVPNSLAATPAKKVERTKNEKGKKHRGRRRPVHAAQGQHPDGSARARDDPAGRPRPYPGTDVGRRLAHDLG